MKNLLAIALVLTTTTASFAIVPYPGNDSDHGPVMPGGYIATYTGNVHVATHDLVVAGAVGERGLSWGRFGNSRTTLTTALFGLGHHWAHTWQWELVNEGRDGQDRAVISLREPKGTVHRFTETSPGQWWPAPSIKQRIVSEGDRFRVLQPGGAEIHFTRTATAQGAAFTLQEILDASGNGWTFAWEEGRLAQVTEPAGRWLKIRYAALAAPAAREGVPPFTVIDRVTASDGQTVAYAYAFLAGADYPVLAKATYPDGVVASYIYAAGRPGERVLLTQAYDPRGSRELRGRIVRYRAEPEAASGQVEQVVAADGQGVFDVLSADSKNARSYALKLPNGGTIYRVYNPGGNPAEDIDALGFSKKHEYDASGRGFKIATTDELGKVTRYENDASGHVIKTTHPDGSSRSWQRDARGRVLVETDELGNKRVYSRDAQGRVIKLQHLDGATEETSYNAFGQILRKKLRCGSVASLTYDARGLVTKTTNAIGATTTYTYDARDRLATITDPRSHIKSYERDDAGRVIKTIYADDATFSVSYDDFGQLIKSIDAAGATRTHVYDVLGRLT
ncbi:MAG: hypothetical protein ACREH8_09160, partial [Opitutaceae bacterium]